MLVKEAQTLACAPTCFSTVLWQFNIAPAFRNMQSVATATRTEQSMSELYQRELANTIRPSFKPIRRKDCFYQNSPANTVIKLSLFCKLFQMLASNLPYLLRGLKLKLEMLAV